PAPHPSRSTPARAPCPAVAPLTPPRRRGFQGGCPRHPPPPPPASQTPPVRPPPAAGHPARRSRNAQPRYPRLDSFPLGPLIATIAAASDNQLATTVIWDGRIRSLA